MHRPVPPVLALVLFAAVVPLASCTRVSRASAVAGSGVAKSEERTVAPFRRIEAAGSVRVRAHAGAEQRLVVEVDDNLLPHLLTTVKDGTLRVGFGPGSWSPKVTIAIDVSAPELDGLELAGSCNATVENIGGASFTAELSGASEVTLAGRVERAAIEASGATHIDAHALEAASVRLDLSGSSNARVHARERLAVAARGATTVRYRGEPELELDTSGSASVRPEPQ
jgi:hypothetical protein